jgi:hypothetical protein
VKLEIRLDADRVAPGQALTGHVYVLEGGRSRSLTLTVGFRERSPGYMADAFGTSGVLHQGDLATGQAVEFRVELPDSALPGVKGEHGELFWEIEAVSDEPGFDTRTSRVFEVAPPSATSRRAR